MHGESLIFSFVMSLIANDKVVYIPRIIYISDLIVILFSRRRNKFEVSNERMLSFSCPLT